LIATLAAAGGHIGLELFVSATVIPRIYNFVAAAGFVVYFIWRAAARDGMLREWGLRRDNFLPALRANLCFGVTATLLMLAYGLTAGTLPVPSEFWLALLLYPGWGIAQQFALQNLVARNLTELVPYPLLRAISAAVLFSAAHYPRLALMGLVFPAAMAFVLIYQRWPNLWAVGLVHGWLAAPALYIVLEENPLRLLLRALAASS
jgi:hypothetical protein